MNGLEDRATRNNARKLIMKAEDKNLISKEEAGFVVTLIERFRKDTERKLQQLTMLQGEVAQLRANERVITDMIDNLIKAAERDRARQETAARIRAMKTTDGSDVEEVEEEEVEETEETTEDTETN